MPKGNDRPDVAALFEATPIRRWGDVLAQGCNAHDIRRALAERTIRRPVVVRALGPVPGILVSEEANGDGLRDPAIAMLLTSGRAVVWGPSAARLQRLSDGMDAKLALLVPHGYSHPPAAAAYAWRRVRDERLLTHGVEEHDTDLGVRLRMTAPARTVADMLWLGIAPGEARGRDDAYRTGLTAMTRYLGRGGETGRVMQYVEEFYPDGADRISKIADSAVEALGSGAREIERHEDEEFQAGGMSP